MNRFKEAASERHFSKPRVETKANKPWEEHHWSTTQAWAELIDNLYRDGCAYGVDSVKFHKKLNDFFRLTINRGI